MFEFTIPFLPAHRKAWLVGGAIRDLLLGKNPVDIDIIAACNAEEYARQLARNIGSRAVRLGKAPCYIYRVAGQGRLFDVADLNGASIQTDLLQRDFSINALAWQLPDGKLIDGVNGRRDLMQKTIRMVSDTIFQKDPIRLLRAFRLAAVLGFEFEVNTLALIKKEAHRIATTAAERIRSELFKILSAPNAAETVTDLYEADLLRHILPEVTDLAHCRQNRYHDRDVFGHTLAALTALEHLLAQPEELFPSTCEQRMPAAIHGIEHPEEIKLAILLHDIGKPAARSIGPDGRIHFYGHAKISAHMTEAIARRLALSNAQRRYITTLVGDHLRPTLLFNEHQKGGLSRRAIIKLFRRSQMVTPDLLLHATADNAGKKKESASLFDSPFACFARELLNIYFNEFTAARKLPGLITGKDLINRFNLAPSPLFKTILDAVEEGRLEGGLRNKAQALKWVSAFLSKNRPNHSS